jgi:hypothetical protein
MPTKPNAYTAKTVALLRGCLPEAAEDPAALDRALRRFLRRRPDQARNVQMFKDSFGINRTAPVRTYEALAQKYGVNRSRATTIVKRVLSIITVDLQQRGEQQEGEE